VADIDIKVHNYIVLNTTENQLSGLWKKINQSICIKKKNTKTTKVAEVELLTSPLSIIEDSRMTVLHSNTIDNYFIYILGVLIFILWKT
jgi:hypothetical protein